MGGTIGVALMGTILNAQMALSFAPIFAHYADILARLPKGLAPSNVLLTPDVRNTLPAHLLNQLQLALAQGLFWVYVLMFICALIGLAAMFFLPGGNAEQYSYKSKKRENDQTEQAEFEPEISSIG
jgi:hypothetical protein